MAVYSAYIAWHRDRYMENIPFQVLYTMDMLTSVALSTKVIMPVFVLSSPQYIRIDSLKML